MVAVYSKDLQIFNAEQFRESVSEEANTRLFFTYGKVQSWSNDSAPPQANSSVTSFNEVWYNMVGAKLITGNDIRHVVPRYNWAANTVYPSYDHCTCSLLLFAPNTPFYVVTSDWNVYKCLSNNNGAISTVMPTQLATSGVINSADGYIWKYMFTVAPSDQVKFTTSEYLPIRIITADDNSLQWDVQQNAVAGAIDVIEVISGGNNYTSNANVSLEIKGDGANCNAYALVNTVTNTISSVYVDNPGRNYTYADIFITDKGSGSGATFKAIIPPTGGHGSDPLRELGGSYLLLNPRLSGSETDRLITNNDYRQIALIKDPLYYASTNVVSNTVVSQLTLVTVNGTSFEYVEDELVYQGIDVANASFTAVVAKWDNANNQLFLTNVRGTPTSDVLLGFNSGASRFVSSITNPVMKPLSGQLLYIDNIKPISRAEDQTEDFKIVLKF